MTPAPGPSRRARWRLLLTVAAVLGAACAGSPLAGGSDSGAWLALTMLDGSHGWGVTTHALLRTDDGGGRWTAATEPPIPHASLNVQAFAANTRAAWLCQQGAALGSSQVPNPEGDPRITRSGLARCVVTADGGSSWATPHDVPGTANTYTPRTRLDAAVTSLSALDDRRAWAVVRTTRTFAGGGHESFDLQDLSVLRTVDGGATWTVQRHRAPASDGSPNSFGSFPWVRFSDSQTGWLAGYLPDTLDVTHDGGVTWQPAGAPLPAPATPADLVSPAPLQLMAGGELLMPVVAGSLRTSFRATFLSSRDGGRTWTATVSPPVSAGSVPVVDALDRQRWWLVDRRTVLATADAGLHWATFQATAPVPDLMDVQMISATVGLAIGFDQSCAVDRTRANTSACHPLLRTHDGGHTWQA